MRLRRPVRLVLAAASLLSLACADAPNAPGGAPAELTALPRPLTGGERLVADASNAFAFGLLKTVVDSSRGDNVFLSPLSASMALGMTANGAAGETRAEMLATLGFGGASMETANASYRSLIDLLRGLDRSVDFRIANAIWYAQGLPVSPSFLAATRETFDAEIAALSFRDPGATATVNAWVKAATNGRIPTIADQLDPDLVMLLVNAIYFKGAWRDRFDPQHTYDGTFLPATGAPQQVRMMRGQPNVRLAGGPGYVAVELPYGANAYAMTILLPTTGTADALAASLDAARWDAIASSLAAAAPTARELEMPRFRMEYEKVLNGTLQALGMRRAFRDAEADFSAMVPGGGLVISEVKQKTFVEVNEEGTEAAAVTAVGLVPTSAPAPTVIDRPFVFVIRERLSGTILFAGRINRIP